SFSKAIGGVGGFIAGSKPLVDFLKNKARSFIYTTALPPAVCAASLAGLTLIQEDASLIGSLWRNIAFLKTRLLRITKTISVESPIVPLIVGSAEDAVNAASKLYENGILIPAIRPPTVPPGTSRLRISLMATHSERDINRLIEILQHVGFLTHERAT
ncbi:MAG: aminotransferase class I/II-fold pyridoxal phosphate-dependent enzyme, partial [Candidatus Brocadia sp.]